MLGIIGGSGLYELVSGKEKRIGTRFGTAPVVLGELSGSPCAFIARHGKRHSIPPHMINHRANISALAQLKVTDLLAISSVGIISDYSPGDLVIVRDFISLGPTPTFFDDFSRGLRHTDMSEPYNPGLAGLIMDSSKQERIRLKDGGVLAHTSGPRFETKGEIKALGKLGANLVGMTSVPEAVLANELGIRFANLAIASNYAARISETPLTIEEVLKNVKSKETKVLSIVGGVAGRI